MLVIIHLYLETPKRAKWFIPEYCQDWQQKYNPWANIQAR